MNIFFLNIMVVYLTYVLSFVFGIAFFKLTKKFSKYSIGFIAILLIYFIAFELLPTVVFTDTLVIEILGLVLGTLVATIIDCKTPFFTYGIVIGYLLANDIRQGICITFFLPILSFFELYTYNLKYIFLITPSVIILGVILGYFINNLSIISISFFISFISGVMIYFLCSKIIPEPKN